MVSNIGDQFGSDFPQKWPNVPTTPIPNMPSVPWPPVYQNPFEFVSRNEFEALKREMEELKKLLLAAKAYDKATGQPDCEMGEKVKMIRQIAQLVGVDLNDVFGADPQLPKT